jgi:hypothetical protein
MATVVLCEPANCAPGLLAGPFGTGAAGPDWMAGQPAGPGRPLAAGLGAPPDVAG